ncbi:MAG TPA: two-component sensor histidine kinase [Sulfurihydrogenibium sp.]|uniref:two-component system sensor histidine kinase NtrB n=1 Tax=Sulfurihydrogenibium sp. (strain YO3AOP1) TaxID=436114 RepID=UPI000172678B|nr:ATP-binding protein [Sulfurihydrogenibium sp. YO3AOP1]ACD66777.1 signal transduction histidine kinase, nitrogen specific, NtrB [Sulfurihydrogenibium sp. YO3AOP1]HBT98959.1 two-component sensor histidine kinase [Sulfurihydrogenibium sp.]
MFEKEILESILEPITVLDFSGKILYSNQEFENYRSILGRRLNKLLSDIINLKYVKEGIPVKNLYKEIDEYKFLIDIFPYENDKVILLLRDITRFYKLEEESKREGTLYAFSKMLSELFHDMKGPVTGIKAATQYLKDNPGETELLDDILYEIKRIEEFINQIAYLNKPEKLNLSKENIHKLIDNVIAKFSKIYPRVEFVRTYDPSLPDIKIDKNQMLNVIENLIKNAIEAINFEGKVEVETGISFDEIYSPKRNKIFIKIKDSGQGIPEDMLDKLFIPFYTTKEFGTGVGLARSYKIVKQHKGILRYIGNSTFEIILPIE